MDTKAEKGGWHYNLLPKEKRDSLFNAYSNGQDAIEPNKFSTFQNELFKLFPRFSANSDKEISKLQSNLQTGQQSTSGGIPDVIFECTNLRELALSFQDITVVPDTISKLKLLKSLELNHCRRLESVSVQVSATDVNMLGLSDCPALKTPPPSVVQQGIQSTLAYLRRLGSGSRACYRTKLMLVGLGGAGKYVCDNSIGDFQWVELHVFGSIILSLFQILKTFWNIFIELPLCARWWAPTMSAATLQMRASQMAFNSARGH